MVIAVSPEEQPATPGVPPEHTVTGLKGEMAAMAANDDTAKQLSAEPKSAAHTHLPWEIPCQQSGEGNRAMLEQGFQATREQIEKNAAGVRSMISVVIVWLVITGVLLIFAFSPVNVDLAIVSMLLGVFIGIIGILAVSTKNTTGLQLYLALDTVLLLLTVAVWGYYIYILFCAARAALDIAADPAYHSVSDASPELLPDRSRSGVGEVTSIEAAERQEGLSSIVRLDETLEPCKKGLSGYGANYFKRVTSVFGGLATRGQMCNYSHYDILDFRKWPVSCRGTCGFDRLATDYALDKTLLDDQKVIAEFLSQLKYLPPQEATACVKYSIRTACVAENTAYHYVILAVIACLILWSCCACLCWIPASLCVAGKHLSDLRKYQRAREAVERGAPSGAAQIELAGV